MSAAVFPGNPAFPSQFVVPPGANMPDGSPNNSGVDQTFVVLGLSTRQHLAATILAGLLAKGVGHAEPYEHAVGHALCYADELLRQDAARP